MLYSKCQLSWVYDPFLPFKQTEQQLDLVHQIFKIIVHFLSILNTSDVPCVGSLKSNIRNWLSVIYQLNIELL